MPSSGVCDEIVKQCSGIATTSGVSKVRPAGRLRTAMKFHPASAQFYLFPDRKKPADMHTSQARRQSSVTGWGQKNIWRSQINFTLIFGREDQKKGLHLGHLPFFGAQVSLWDGGMLLSVGALRNLMVRISRLDNKFRREDQKKVLRREILDVVLAYTRVFLL